MTRIEAGQTVTANIPSWLVPDARMIEIMEQLRAWKAHLEAEKK